MQVTLDIDGRKALPLRAIPYVTSWNEAPDSIVSVLAAPKTIKPGQNLEIRNKHNELFAYQMDAQGNFAQVPSSQWENWIVTFASLTKKLRANEREAAENENHASWRINAVLKLPDNVFVWLDEFQPWYSYTRSLKNPIPDHDDDPEREDDTLCLTPIFPPEIENRVWRYADGFVATEPEGLHEHVDIHRHQEKHLTTVARLNSADLPIDEKQTPHAIQAKVQTGTADTKVRKNKKTWDDAKLLALLNESILPGATHTNLAQKHGISRQRIGKLLANAQEKFKVRNNWTNGMPAAKPKFIKGKY